MKPTYKIQARSKKTKNFVNILAFWRNEDDRISGTLDQDVAKIVLKNGQIITNENVWFNMWDNSGEESVTTPPEKHEAYPGVEGDEIPF